MSLLMIGCALGNYSSAAPGDVDLTFDPGSGIDGEVHAAALQPDGKVIIGGEFTTVKGLLRPNLARINADGGGDATFNAGAVADRYVSAIALQVDGKVLITRDFYNVTGAPPGHKVARLTSDGRLDDSFLPDIGTYPAGSGFTCMTVQPDGKVLLGGYFNDSYVNDENLFIYYRRSLLLRLNADGTSDSTFDSTFADGNEKYSALILSVALQRDGKIPCQKAADANDDGQVNISDAVFLLSYLFLGGEAPADPLGNCEADPTPDGLTCESFPACK